ncbi:type VI secretion system membrane subunit TssM [Pseudomonas sp. 148P]|uniref:Type VI secretion system membrane subunit TssM n=1 Tax=Pseudomonas ulcerans TaxID=3115852 RepID=A0ABU7HUT9_9PSED|nr:MULTISPECIES: type VI secretion system membrane subunit TssM [unclassified Pseudomonas]MEE1924031.1 type VI secretion system membrane subunit TssM [Pseudomonas sp. 147P]MEE1935206.1 type VI secretion system membrane subunit TssM [Pseudomonas sp. 148P]
MKNIVTTLARQRWLWSLLPVLALALTIWFFGPLLAVADQRIWESVSSRVLTLCILLLSWGLMLLLVRQRHASRAAPRAADVQPPQAHEPCVDEELSTLRTRFKQAQRNLRRPDLYGNRSQRWRKELPWYLLIGPQGSGKTSLLDHSGIRFPLQPVDGQTDSPPPTTSQCDWYFAEQGVLLDTGGRYLCPRSAADTQGWRTLLKLLRQRRRGRPLDGVMVSVPITSLIDGDDIALKHLAGQIRSRLLEIHSLLHCRVPVYLVLTKADEVQGFDAFFDHLTREESQQALGIAFTQEQRGTEPAVLHEAVEGLLRRLNSLVVTRLQQERSIENRGRILDFPHRLGLMGTQLALLVDTAFAGNRYEPESQLRGIYLTSAPHWAPDTPASLPEDNTPADAAPPARTLRSMQGKPRFIHHLLSRVIFPDAGLAMLDTHASRRLRWGQRSLYAGALACLVLFGVIWATGFMYNHHRFDQLRTIGEQFTRQHDAVARQDDALAILPLLDTSLAAVQVFPPASNLALHERNGLYQGEPSAAVLRQRYAHELNEQLLPRVAQQLEGQIRANLNDRDALLDHLRAYLMLGLPEQRDRATLEQWAATDWSRRYAGEPEARSRLSEHFSRLLEQPLRYPLDDTLVAQARQSLQKVPLASLAYRSLQERSRALPQYRLDQHLGPQGGLFEGGHTVIPGLYTQKGYQQQFLVHASGLVRELLRDNWVTGQSSSLDPLQLQTLMAEVEQLYFHDYATHWNQALARLTLRPLDSLAAGADQAGALVAANSPLLQLLVQVRDNTRFPTLGERTAELADAADALAEPVAAAGQVANAVAGQALSAIANPLADSAKSAVQRRFEPLHRLLDDSDAASPELIPALTALADLQQQLNGLNQGSHYDQAAFELAKVRINGKRSALDQVRVNAGRLPAPVNGWLRAVSDDNWQLLLADAYRYVNHRYQGELYSVYSSALHQRFPFHAHSTSDVALADFREFFKAQGTADRFIETYLEPFASFDGSRYRLRSVDGRSLPLSPAVLHQMNNVRLIRQGFFAESASEPLIRFSLEPYSLDASLSRADFRLGGQHLEYRHGPIVPGAFQWPAVKDEGLSSLIVEEQNGRRTGLQENTGPWSLFRLLDLMDKEPHRGRDVLMLKADVGGLRANYLLLSQRSPNPFDMKAIRNFQLPAVL